MSDPKKPAATRKLEKKQPTVRITNDGNGAADDGGSAATKQVDSPFKNYENRNSMPDGDNEAIANRAGSNKPVTKVFGRRASPAGDASSPEQADAPAAVVDDMGSDNPVTGWLVVVDGPGRGNHVKVGYGMHHIGRGDDQQICINFGDETISRENHAKIEYDPETREFFVIKGDNRVYLNGKRVGAGGEMDLGTGDVIKIGDTSLRFVAFCGPDFDWNDAD